MDKFIMFELLTTPIAWLVVAALAAGLARGFSGFGSALIYMPLVAAVYDPRVAAVTLLLMNYLIAEFSGGNRRFRKFVQGQPSLLVHDGQLILAHMAKEHVSMDELERALREHGITTYHDVALGVLEVDGSISLLKYEDLNPTAQTHLSRRKHTPKHE
jgi:uncharacterized membrane protein YcaP (DUF421 family)